jgi:kynureninase
VVQLGTPPILSIAPLLGSLPILHEAGIARLRSKSLALTSFLMDALNDEAGDCGFTYANPMESERRGGHIAILHEKAAGICADLKTRGVIPDFRPPNIIRLAPAPLYNSFSDCAMAARTLGQVMAERAYEAHPMTRGLVA